MNRRGVEMDTLFKVLVLVAVLAVVFFAFLPKILNTGKAVSEIETCGGFGFEGRCFGDNQCGNVPGWKPLVKVAGQCPEERPHCCFLDDAEAYYPPNTALLRIESDPSATFRLVTEPKNPTTPVVNLDLETGEKGSERYRLPDVGIPGTARFGVKLRPGQDVKYCKLEIAAGGKTYNDSVLSCAPGSDGIVTLTPSLLSFNDLRRTVEGREALDCTEGASSATCKAEITVSAGADDEALTPVGTYTVYFARK